MANMGRGRARTIAGVVVLLACCACGFGLDPSLDISEYAHTSWKVRDGFSKGYITSIAQTPDGYLWLGTEFGSLRFDGVRNVPWEPTANEHLPNNFIRSLLAARDGTLWIGTAGGLASWKDGKLIQYPELTGKSVDTLLEDREGTIWTGALGIPSGRLCAISRGNAQCYGEDGSFGRYVESLYEDSGGNLWAAAATGLWRWKPGPPKLYPLQGAVVSSQAFVEGASGALLIATSGGIWQLVNGKAEAYPVPGSKQQFKPIKVLRDRNGSLWIGTSQGLLHIHEGRTDAFAQSDGLSGDNITSLFEDREGSIWVSTLTGLDRFRDFAVPTISIKQGLSHASVFSVVAAKDGTVWLGTPNGLHRWKDGQITLYRKGTARAVTGDAKQQEDLNVREITDSGLPDAAESLGQDGQGRIWVATKSGIAYFEGGRFVPVSGVPGGEFSFIAGDGAENLWIANQDHGLFHLHRESVVAQVSWAKLGRNDYGSTLVSDPAKGGMWLGFWKGGVAYFKDGQVRASYAAKDGLGKGQVTDLQVDRDGTLWATTEGGLSRVKDGRVATLTSKNGLPCDAADWMVGDAQSVWMYMACGLVRIARPELDAWVADPKRTIQATVFDSSDGVVSHSFTSGYRPHVARSPDGKIWFLPLDGVSVIDPHHLPVNRLPPPVHVEEIIADGKTYDASNGLRLPPRVHNLEIHYTALSLVAPEKVRFRIKLEGQDPDWREQTDRHENYTNLGPGHYRFRVLACNNSGVWNEEGATLDFAIAPAYWQTNWFRSLCAVAFLAMLWTLHRLRLRQQAYQFNMRLEERVGERTRIARDLHDTLLQNFHGVLGRLQAVSNDLPEGKSKEQLESTIDQAAEAITEGRDAVQGLRTSTVEKNDLALAIRTVGEELAADPSNGRAAFEVHVEGAPRDIQPILRDEIYRIATEALRNAFRYAQARRIEADLRYGDRQFQLRVRDDGKGIDPKVLGKDGREGHFGLHGMRERAKLAGGKLTVWSQIDAGTEIELTIPASTAYGTERRSWLAERLSRKATEMREKMKS